MNQRKNHHYVSQSYLKAWDNNHHKIWTYRLLVSHPLVPEWSQMSTKSVAVRQHLYTRIILGANSDEIEIWMDQDIETPAQIALAKARSNEPLNPEEWKRLLRFVALHYLRSPANYIEHIRRMRREMPSIIDKTLKTAFSEIESTQQTLVDFENKSHPDTELLPMKVTQKIDPNSEWGLLKTDVLMGRSSWLFSIRHILSNTYKVLNKHTWSLLQAPAGICWITSDHPVITLNYYSPGSYDFGGGWGNNGSEIIFPLSPQFLLYTQVGQKRRITTISKELATDLNRLIAENAHRHIFSLNPVDDISKIRSRRVDIAAYDYERKEWETWHARQRDLERDY